MLHFSNITIEQMPGAKLGLVDYFCGYPFPKSNKNVAYDDHFVAATKNYRVI